MRSASDVPFEKGLHDLGGDTWAYLQPQGQLGYSNAGLVAGKHAGLLVDTLFDLRMTRELLDAVDPVLVDRPLRWAVNTHANGDHTFGNALLPQEAAILSSVATAGEFDDYPPEAMLASQRADELGRLDDFVFEGIELRHPDRTFTGATTVDLEGRAVDLVEVGPAHTRGDVIVHVPDSGVVFAGDVLFIGIAPMMWAGPLTKCIDAIDRICALGPRIIVPGHGPVTDVTGTRRAQAYLEVIREMGERAIGAGMSPIDALLEFGPAPFDDLLEPERMLSIADLAWAEMAPGYQRRTGLELHLGMEKLAAGWAAR